MSRSIIIRAVGVVSKRSRSLLILFEFTNHPVCAAKERDLFIEAQPPLLEKRRGMDPSRAKPRSPPPRVATCRTVLVTNQFSIFIRGYGTDTERLIQRILSQLSSFSVPSNNFE